MPNRVIYESCLDSETIDALGDIGEVQFKREFHLADDRGCYESTPKRLVAKIYPNKLVDGKMTIDECERRHQILLENECVFDWWIGKRRYSGFINWGEFNSSYCLTDDGTKTSHRPKTPDPPKGKLPFCDALGVNGGWGEKARVNRSQRESREPKKSQREPNPNPDPVPNHDPDHKKDIEDQAKPSPRNSFDLEKILAMPESERQRLKSKPYALLVLFAQKYKQVTNENPLINKGEWLGILKHAWDTWGEKNEVWIPRYFTTKSEYVQKFTPQGYVEWVKMMLTKGALEKQRGKA